MAADGSNFSRAREHLVLQEALREDTTPLLDNRDVGDVAEIMLDTDDEAGERGRVYPGAEIVRVHGETWDLADPDGLRAVLALHAEDDLASVAPLNGAGLRELVGRIDQVITRIAQESEVFVNDLRTARAESEQRAAARRAPISEPEPQLPLDEIATRFAAHDVSAPSVANDHSPISALDDSSTATTPTISETATPTNAAPTDITYTGGTVAENLSANQPVATITGVDANAGDTLTYSLTNSDGGRFGINAATGVITLATSLDYETATAHTIVARVTDAAGATYDETITIAVTDISNTINGTAGVDTIAGTTENDTIYGLGSDDTLSGSGGNDVLDGGSGNDTVDYSGMTTAVSMTLNSGGTVTVTLAAGNTDTLVSIENVIGGSGNDSIYGDTGANILTGGDGNDTMLGGFGADTLYGGNGDDQLFGGEDQNILDGGAGNDLLAGGSAADTMIGGAGNDTFFASGGYDVVDYSYVTTNLTITTASGWFTVVTIAAGDTDTLWNFEGIIGGSGDDTLGSATSGETLNGGAGNDVINFSSSSSAVVATLNSAGNATLTSGGFAVSSQYTNFEGIFTGSGNDTITGDSSTNLVDSGSGNDLISGSGGNDTLRGGLGNDSLSGDADDDTLQGGSGNDTLNGGSGNDTADYSYTGVNLTIALNSAGTATVTVAAGDTDSLLGIERVIGGSGNDTITGDAVANHFTGGAGNDVLSGGANDDTLIGGSGNDLLDGGADYDLASYSYASSNMTVTLNSAGTVTVTVAAGDTDTLIAIEQLTAGSGNDTITGDTGANVLDGGSGNDSLNGGAGDDTLSGGLGNDVIVGGTGSDTMTGGVGDDLFYFDYSAGSPGNDSVDGGAAGSWTDIIDIDNAGTFTVVVGGVTTTVSTTGGQIDYGGVDTSGTIQFADGSQITFTNIERITY
jgi:Ca2+-binding RTX toxin-like protein